MLLWRLRNSKVFTQQVRHPGETMVQFPSKSELPEKQKSDDLSFSARLSVKTAERLMPQLRPETDRERKFFLTQSFIIQRNSVGWTMTIHIGEAIFFTQSVDPNVNSRNTLTVIPRILFEQTLGTLWLSQVAT